MPLAMALLFSLLTPDAYSADGLLMRLARQCYGSFSRSGRSLGIATLKLATTDSYTSDNITISTYLEHEGPWRRQVDIAIKHPDGQRTKISLELWGENEETNELGLRPRRTQSSTIATLSGDEHPPSRLVDLTNLRKQFNINFQQVREGFGAQLPEIKSFLEARDLPANDLQGWALATKAIKAQLEAAYPEVAYLILTAPKTIDVLRQAWDELRRPTGEQKKSIGKDIAFALQNASKAFTPKPTEETVEPDLGTFDMDSTAYRVFFTVLRSYVTMSESKRGTNREIAAYFLKELLASDDD